MKIILIYLIAPLYAVLMIIAIIILIALLVAEAIFRRISNICYLGADYLIRKTFQI